MGFLPNLSISNIDKSLDTKKKCLDLISLINSNGMNRHKAGTDLYFLNMLSLNILNLEKENFEHNLNILIDIFEARNLDFVKNVASSARIQGWCTTISHACGLFYIGNNYFLVETGRAISNTTQIIDRLENLLINSISYVNTRFDRSITGPCDWLEMIDDEDITIRKTIAKSVHFLARISYEVQSDNPIKKLAKTLSADNFDILMLSISTVKINFLTIDSYFYQVINENVNYFQESLKNNITTTLKDNPHINEMLKTLNFCIINLGNKLDLVEYDHSSNKSTSKKSDNMSDLEKASYYYRTGDQNRARNKLPNIRRIKKMGLGEIHVYLSLVGHLYNQKLLYRSLTKLKLRLFVLNEKMCHMPNYIARVIEFNKVSNDYLILENSNYAFNYFKKLAPPYKSKIYRGNTVLFFAINDCRVLPSLAAPLMTLLLNNDVKVRSIQNNRFLNKVVLPWEGSHLLNSDSTAIIGSDLDPDSFHQRWSIQLDKNEVIANGINYYQGIYERISRIFKVYNIDWSLPLAKTHFNNFLRKVDRTITVLDSILEQAKKDSLKVRFATLQSHFAPDSAIRSYCAAHSDYFEHITFSSSYENWATNMSGKTLTSLALLNNTQNIKPSIPAFGTEQQFKFWLENTFNNNKEHYIEKSKILTSANRSGAPTKETAVVLHEIKEFKTNGGKVFCLLGKIPYDLAVPYQGGPAHKSMVDWLNHSVDTITESKNLLYIKPHPHEMNYAISARPMESFVDLIINKEANNIRILPHKGVNIQSMLSEVDVFLCWNGSSIAELGAQGAKIIAADDWADKNYPVNVTLPNDRDHYREILLGKVEVEMDDEFSVLSAAYTCFLTEAPFSIPYDYVSRSSNNLQFNKALVSFDKLTSAKLDKLKGYQTKVKEIFNI